MTPDKPLPPVCWKSVAFMGALLAVECGAVLAVAEWFRRKEEKEGWKR